MDVPPSGVGLVTVTPIVPLLAGKLPGIAICSCVGLLSVGTMVIDELAGKPVRVTVDEVVNPLPLMTSGPDVPSKYGDGTRGAVICGNG